MSSINERNNRITGSFFTTNDIGRVFSWTDVATVHKIRNGVYQRGGQLISLLTDFGKINPCYPDFQGETADEIFYHGAGRRGDQKMDVHNRALHDAIRSGHSVPLFCKMKVNEWKFMGFWKVVDAAYVYEEINKRHVWNFVLRRVEVEDD